MDRGVSNFIMQALTGRPLTIYGDGSQSRSWGYIDDIVEGLERFFWREPITHRGPLNIGNDREIPVIDVARYICDLIPGSRIEYQDPVPQDPTNRRPDLNIVQSVLPGWTCHIPYERGVSETLEWFRSRMKPGLAAFCA
jgi:nucleoside-diphosphate-sugar epimerase